MIQVDEQGKIVDFKNIEWDSTTDPDSTQLYQRLKALKAENAPIPIVYKDLIN